MTVKMPKNPPRTPGPEASDDEGAEVGAPTKPSATTAFKPDLPDFGVYKLVYQTTNSLYCVFWFEQRRVVLLHVKPRLSNNDYYQVI